MALLLKGLKISVTHLVLSEIGSRVGSWHVGFGVGGGQLHTGWNEDLTLLKCEQHPTERFNCLHMFGGFSLHTHSLGVYQLIY